MHLRAIPFLIAAIALASCAGRKGTPLRPAAVETQVGTISMIDFDHNFVLIDTVYTPESGAILEEISPANENAATLKVSPEKQPPFIIADILKGTPRVGDRVMLGKQAQPQPAPGEKPAANGTTPANEKPVATQPSP